MFKLHKDITIQLGVRQTKILVKPQADIVFVNWNKDTDILTVAIKLTDDNYTNSYQELYSWKVDVAELSIDNITQKLFEQPDFEGATLI